MIWFGYIALLSQCEEGWAVFKLIKLFLPAVAAPRGEGRGVSTLRSVQYLCERGRTVYFMPFLYVRTTETSPKNLIDSLTNPSALHNTENTKQIFPEKELCGHSPNFHIHVSVSDLYISPIDLPCLFC
jgi:hypothetical protein